MTVVEVERIIELAEGQQLSLAELAEVVGVSSSVFYMLRKGDRQDMVGATLRETARVLNTSTDYLLGLTDDPRPAQPASGLSIAESRLVYDVTGAENDVRRLLGLFEALTPEQREIVRRVAEEMVNARAARVVE